jgi:hypothetical protein
MKLSRGIALGVLAVALSGCASAPDLIEQSSAPGITPTQVSRVLIVVDGNMFATPLYGRFGRAYMTGLGRGLQEALTGVPSQVVEVDAMSFGNPALSALTATRPSHAIRVYTISSTQRNGTPIDSVWQMNVDDVTISPTATAANVSGKPVGIHVQLRSIYRARAEGDTCFDAETLADKCGEAMGKTFGDALRKSHAVLMTEGASS